MSSYTSAEHLKRHKKRSGLGTETAPIPKKRRCSGNLKFQFKEQCIFCGDGCQLERDKKNPTRWRRAVLCRTATRPGQKTFKETILDICTKRDDEQAHQVRSRVEGALSDLHAADGRYHVDCMTSFMSPRSINTAANAVLDAKKNGDLALEYVIHEMSRNSSQIWNSLKIWHLYEKHGGKDLVRKSLLKKIKDHFGDDIAVLSSSGLASLIVFRKSASTLLNLVNDPDEDELSILTDKLAKTITSEIRDISVDKS